MLVKAAAVLTPGTRATTGLAISIVASFLAAWGVFAVGHHLHGRRVALLLTFLAALPVGQVQWMGYTESLFTAFAAWSRLYGAHRPLALGRHLVSVPSADPPDGHRGGGRGHRHGPLSLRHRFVLVGAARCWLADVGLVACAWSWDGYFAVQRLLHNDWEMVAETCAARGRSSRTTPGRSCSWAMATLTLIVSGGSLTPGARTGSCSLCWSTGVLPLIVLGSGGVYFPRARFPPGFPLLLPLALHLSRASARFRVLAATAALLSSAYWSAYMALVWPSAP